MVKVIASKNLNNNTRRGTFLRVCVTFLCVAALFAVWNTTKGSKSNQQFESYLRSMLFDSSPSKSKTALKNATTIARDDGSTAAAAAANKNNINLALKQSYGLLKNITNADWEKLRQETKKKVGMPIQKIHWIA